MVRFFCMHRSAAFRFPRFSSTAVPLIIAAFLFVASLGSRAVAQPGLSDRLSLARLPGVAVTIGPIDPTAAKDGLSPAALKEQIVAALREAKIDVLAPELWQKTPQRPELFLAIGLLPLPSDEYIYSIQISVRQRVASMGQPRRTVETALPMTAVTWSTSNIFGITPKDRLVPDVKTTVGEMLDQFTSSFRRANPK